MNLANKLTLSRVVLVGVFLLLLLSRIPWGATAALAVFVLASATDFVDGYLARSRNMITDFGKLMDPLADKILVSAAFISFVGLGLLPSWIAVTIIGREFAVTGLRNLAASRGTIVPADRIGKAKTVSQMVAILALLLAYAIKIDVLPRHRSAGWLSGFYHTPFSVMKWVLIAVVLALTLASGWHYLRTHRRLLLENARDTE